MRILALPSRREAPEPSTPGATLAGSRSPPGGSTLGAVAASDVHLLLCVPRLWARAPSLAPIAARLVRRAVAGLAARGRGDSGGGCGLAEALPPVAEGSGCGDGGTEVGGARALAALLGNIIEAGYPRPSVASELKRGRKINTHPPPSPTISPSNKQSEWSRPCPSVLLSSTRTTHSCDTHACSPLWIRIGRIVLRVHAGWGQGPARG